MNLSEDSTKIQVYALKICHYEEDVSFKIKADHLRNPSSFAACLRDVPGSFFSKQNST
jgi:hypothetical protein